MISLKKNKAYGQVRSQLKDGIMVLKKANAFMKKADPYIMWSTWYNAITDGLYSLGIFTFVGYSSQTIFKSFTQSKSFTPGLLAICIIGYILYQFAKLLIRSIEKYRDVNFDCKVERTFEQEILQKSISLDTGRLTDADFQEKNRHAGRYRSIIEVFKYQANIFSAIVGSIVSFTVVAVISWPVLIIGILPFVPETIVLFIFNKKRREQRDEFHISNMKKHAYLNSLNQPDHLVQSKLFKFVPFLYGRFIEFSDNNRNKSIKLNKEEIKWNSLIELAKTILNSFVLVYLGRGCLNGTVTFAQLLMVVGSLSTFGSSMFRISNNFLHFQEDCKDYLEFDEFMKIQPLIDESKAKEIILSDVPVLSLKNVKFYYPRNPDRIILENCNLTINPGEKIAIVGKNGAGKTTILKLLAKIFAPVEGRVFINDTSVMDITQESLTNYLVYITQGAGVNDLPLKEALTGSLNPDMDRLVQASKYAGTYELIMGRKKGYDLSIRSHFEREGEDFSGGEYQRLSLTSVFYRLLDKKVFIAFFDEPMSHCDIETRNHFYRTINSISGKTIVAVAHDHNYLHYFERVIEIKDGSVASDMKDKVSIIEYQRLLSEELFS